ncbi:unnamed protein product [Gongylonema pulchrum]|uniref:glucuronosyltransferase n=1 Tax=Gongylonema pulchrum TaxID=637853 RepID=A0A3P6PWK7_9BILA|nr:unnamed protein product [Gongylonema pulchrum]
MQEKLAQATYVLSSADPFFDFPKPTIHKVKELGGVAVPKAKPLNERWSTIMSQRKKAILVSFGSVVASYMMPNETKQALLNAFDLFPDITFIWKYEKEEHYIADGHPNVITDKWLPQTDLLGNNFFFCPEMTLAHPNLVAFLTHGGMNSITETLCRGKPVIVVPVFGDQLRNAVLAKRSGFGIMLSVSDLQVEKKLSDAFEQIINDER